MVPFARCLLLLAAVVSVGVVHSEFVVEGEVASQLQEVRKDLSWKSSPLPFLLWSTAPAKEVELKRTRSGIDGNRTRQRGPNRPHRRVAALAATRP